MADSTGLVYKQTSPTQDYTRLQFDRRSVRVGRARRGIITSARVLVEGLQVGGHRFRTAMVTLTYRPGVQWSADHVSAYVDCVRKWLRRQGFDPRYVWALELTKAGVPHYHIIWMLPRGVTMPKADMRGWWKHGMTRSEWARNAVGYIAKYASKGCDTADLPHGARLQGAGGLNRLQMQERRWWRSPKWVRDVTDECADVIKCIGGWLCRETGEVIASPWRLVSRTRAGLITIERGMVPA